MLLTRISDRVSRSCMARWEKSGNILIIACIAVLAVSAFGGTLSHELVWDDVSILKYIDSVIEQGGLKAVLISQFATHIEEGYVSGYYRPVPIASLWFDSIISPFFPYQYHLVNILLHGINSVLVFLVFRIFLTRFAAIARNDYMWPASAAPHVEGGLAHHIGGA